MKNLIETIKINNGNICNIEYHNNRFNNTRIKLFGCNEKIKLENHIKLPGSLQNKIIKCRIIYQNNILKIEYSNYQISPVTSLKLVISDKIEYSYKYENRSELINLKKKKENCDDILIIKKNRITDTSYSNILLFDGKKWYTPKFPLLKGTQRQYLLENKVISEKDILTCDLKKYSKIRLINAMIDFNDQIDIDINNIL